MGGYNQTVHPLQPDQVPREYAPYFIEIETVGTVAAGATQTQNYVVGPRNFVWTHIGFMSQEVGVPAAGQLFKISIQDIGASVNFQPVRFLVGAITGRNDKDMELLSVGWRFTKHTTISVQFENFGAIAADGYLVLHGYLE